MSGIATAIAVGTIGGAVIAGSAAKSAADTQAGAIDKASQISEAAAAQARLDVIDSYGEAYKTFSEGLKQSANTLTTDQSAQTVQQAATNAAGQISPYAETGSQAYQKQAALSGALGADAQQKAQAEFNESPGQKYLREQAEQALLRNQAAIGGLGGGNVRTALQEQAIGIAAGQQQQQIDNLGQVSGLGAQASQNLSNLTANTGTNIANIQQQQNLNQANLQERLARGQSDITTGRGNVLANIATGQGTTQSNLALQSGEAQAASILGQNTAIQSGLQGVANAAGYYLKNQPTTPAITSQQVSQAPYFGSTIYM
jgi:hypothetical protein